MSEIKKFEDVLDECLERMLVKGETLDQCLQLFPEHANEIKPLLETVVAARRVMPVQPRAEFRERARFQFNAALQQAREKKRLPLFAWGWQLRPASVAIAILLALSLAGGGTVAAARASMPDSPLYPVKLATEQVQMTLTFSDLGKAELHAKLADERVNEIAHIAANHPEKIAEASENMKEHLGKISSLLARAPVTISAVPQAAPTPAPAPPPAAFAPTKAPAEGAERLKPEAAPETTPAPAAVAAERAPGLEKKRIEPAGIKVASSANETKKEAEKASPKDKRAKLKSTVEDHASSNSARLRSLLETAPESAKPALQRAIEESEKEYEKAIKSLED